MDNKLCEKYLMSSFRTIWLAFSRVRNQILLTNILARNFDNFVSIFILQELLTRHKTLSATFLEEKYDKVCCFLYRSVNILVVRLVICFFIFWRHCRTASVFWRYYLWWDYEFKPRPNVKFCALLICEVEFTFLVVERNFFQKLEQKVFLIN